LLWFAERVLDGLSYSEELTRFIILKTRFHERFAAQLNERQAKMVARIFREGLSGFEGGVSAENYIRITGTSRATATRDLQELVSIGAFTRTGSLKGTRYNANYME